MQSDKQLSWWKDCSYLHFSNNAKELLTAEDIFNITREHCRAKKAPHASASIKKSTQSFYRSWDWWFQKTSDQFNWEMAPDVQLGGETVSTGDIQRALDCATSFFVVAVENDAVVNVSKSTTNSNGYPKYDEHLAPVVTSRRSRFIARKGKDSTVQFLKACDLPPPCRTQGRRWIEVDSSPVLWRYYWIHSHSSHSYERVWMPIYCVF